MNYDDKTSSPISTCPQGSPFVCSWWYRTEFKLPLVPGSAGKNKTDWLHFNGINYRANIWLNGQKIADAKDVAGTYRTFEFNISKYLKHGGTKNTLAVEVFAPGKDDLGITWVDWNPTPPDKNMGIWKEVFLTQTADVTVRNPFVASKLVHDYKSAALTVYADLQNTADIPVRGVLRAEIDKIKITQPVTARRRRIQNRPLHAPEKFAALKLAHPHLWWPYTIGEPVPLPRQNFLRRRRPNQRLRLHAASASAKSLAKLIDKNFRLFKINGRNILIRGAAWAPDLASSLGSRHGSTPTWPTSTTWASTPFASKAASIAKSSTKKPIASAFWSCPAGLAATPGNNGKDWQDEQRDIAAAALKDQIHILRQHPSVFVWLNGSDGPPPPNVEEHVPRHSEGIDWPNPVVSSAAEEVSTQSPANPASK